MNKRLTGAAIGAVAGVIDVIPMQLQGLTWDAKCGAFSMWVVVGFLTATSALKLPPLVKGIVIAFLVLLPSAFIIGWHEPSSLIPIVAMTLVLGGGVGLAVGKLR